MNSASVAMHGSCRHSTVTYGGVAALCLLVMVGGCTSLFGMREADSAAVFVLAPEIAVPPRPDPAGPVVLVSRPSAGPGFTSAQMVYTDMPYQLEAFARHRWADTPANMIEPLIVGALESSGSFRQVAVAATRARADLRLDSEIMRLVQVFAEGQSRVEIAMRVSLVRVQDSRLIDSRVLKVSEPVAEANPYAGVIAANRAIARLLDDLQAFVAGAVPRGEQRTPPWREDGKVPPKG